MGFPVTDRKPFEFTQHEGKTIALITDIPSYINRRTDIEEWAKEMGVGVTLNGIVLVFDSEKDAIHFKLRWA